MIITSPGRVTAIIRLPSHFPSAWSPGFDLHVTGEGDTPEEATESLVANIRDLAQRLLDEADHIELP